MSEILDAADAPVEHQDGGTDFRRVIVETDRAGIVLRESLRFRRRHDPERIVIIDDDLGELVEVPHYRVASFAPNRLIPYVAAALQNFPPDLAELALVEINEERSIITDDAEAIHVDVEVTLDDARVLVARVHRGCLMRPVWPHDLEGRFLNSPVLPPVGNV